MASTHSPSSLEKEEKKAPSPDPDVPAVEGPNTGTDSALALLKLINTHDDAHPIHWGLWKKWAIVIVYCTLQVFVTLTSTTYVSVEFLIQEKFGGSTQVITLGQSMFIVGNAVGPAFLGPLADIGGRKWVYVGSILVYAILNIGTALARNLPMLIIFQFLCGAAGSTALSNVAGTIADLWGDRDDAGQPMALFVLSANYGPSLGSPIGEWIAENANMGWRWSKLSLLNTCPPAITNHYFLVFYINIIIGGVFAFCMIFVPETLPKIVISRTVQRHGSVDENALAIAAGESKLSVLREMRFVLTMALRIMTTEPIVIFLGLYNGWAYGLLFLYLDGVFDVFAINNGLSDIGASLTYLNFCVGVTITFLFMPVQTYLYKRDRERHGGHNRPEARFITSLVTIWLFPISLFWFAFTSNGHTSFWSPVVAGGVLGFCDPLLYQSMLSYITDAYPNVAASAIAAFLIPSFIIAAAFAHIGIVMFDNMSTTWAMATLGFISFGIVALVNVLYFFGPKIRSYSKLARKF